jgi:hypothetical protein
MNRVLFVVVDDIELDRIQGIEQKMRVHLASEHALFQGQQFFFIFVLVLTMEDVKDAR